MDYISKGNEIDLRKTVFPFFVSVPWHLPPSCHVRIESSWMKIFIIIFYQMLNKQKLKFGFMNDVIQFFGIIFQTCETPLFTFTPDNIVPVYIWSAKCWMHQFAKSISMFRSPNALSSLFSVHCSAVSMSVCVLLSLVSRLCHMDNYSN